MVEMKISSQFVRDGALLLVVFPGGNILLPMIWH
jgi:hypothetical protein